MAWWEGVEEPRILLAPEPCAVGIGAACLLLLRHPKSGAKTCYLFVDGLILELHWFKQSHGSWFLGDHVCEGAHDNSYEPEHDLVEFEVLRVIFLSILWSQNIDGSLYTATPVDPVFLLLPIFEEARMKKWDSPGMFRELEEILFISDYPGYQQLLSIADTCMQVVCEVKEVGSSRVFRLNDEKVLAWLCSKVSLLRQTLPALDQNYTAQNEKNTLADAVSILGEYLKDEPWMKILCNHLNVNLDERTSSDTTASQAPKASGLGSTDLLQDPNKADKKTAKVQKLKKVQVETESRNIKEMFSRVRSKKI